MPITLQHVLLGTFVNGKIGHLSFRMGESIFCIISFSTIAQVRRQSCKRSLGSETELRSLVLEVPSVFCSSVVRCPPAARPRVPWPALGWISTTDSGLPGRAPPLLPRNGDTAHSHGTGSFVCSDRTVIALSGPT